MSFDFTETLTIEVPDVEEQISAFKESEYKSSHGLIIEVAAIHEGMTANFNYYPAKALQKSLESWVSPYPKPIIMNHDPYSEPVGRVMAAKMSEESDGTPYVMLQVAITDPEAISKIVDQRYLTGSVGGSAKEANCSVCGADWAQASINNIPCKHSRGKTYKGKLCYREMNGIGFKEYSFVNMPADQRSNIRSIKTEEGEDNDGWVRAARVFSLNMNDEEILEFSESTSDSNVLEGMKRKDANPIYMQLKGAFLSALAVAESEGDLKETKEELDVDNETINQEEEDVLAVAEGLSSDLAEPEVEEEEEEASTEEVTEEEDELTEDEEVKEDEETEESEVEEGDKPEAQESPKSEDINPDDSSGAPVSREDDEENDNVEEQEQEEEVSEEEEVDEDEDSETDLSEAITTLESRVEELEAREQSLLEENTRLKSALKRNLAERVVDTKIALGFVKPEARDDELNEHASRSAASLADSLRDLAGMSRIAPDTSAPSVNNESLSVEEDDNSVILDEEDEEIEEDKKVDPEDVFVDALMGRRKL